METIFKIGDEYYKGIVNIENIQRGRLLKDITKMENITQDIYDSYGKKPKFACLRDASMKIIPQDGEKVKPQTEKNDERPQYQSMIDDRAMFVSALDDYDAGRLNRLKPIPVTAHTPQVYLKLDLSDKNMWVHDRKITMPYSVIEKAIGLKASTSNGELHQLTLDDLKELPESLYNPVMVLDSNTPGSLEIITQFFDTKGAPAMVAMAMDFREKRGRGECTINSIRSIYGRDNANTIINRFKNGHGRYINKNLASQWLAIAKVQTLGINELMTGSAHIIIDDGDTVKLFQEKNVKKNGAFDSITKVISLFESANVSTLAHETIHFFDDCLCRR